MEEIKNKQSFYEEPLLEVVHLTEKDIITTSGELWDGEDKEGELTPIYGFDNLG